MEMVLKSYFLEIMVEPFMELMLSTIQLMDFLFN